MARAAAALAVRRASALAGSPTVSGHDGVLGRLGCCPTAGPLSGGCGGASPADEIALHGGKNDTASRWSHWQAGESAGPRGGSASASAGASGTATVDSSLHGRTDVVYMAQLWSRWRQQQRHGRNAWTAASAATPRGGGGSCCSASFVDEGEGRARTDTAAAPRSPWGVATALAIDDGLHGPGLDTSRGRHPAGCRTNPRRWGDAPAAAQAHAAQTAMAQQSGAARQASAEGLEQRQPHPQHQSRQLQRQHRRQQLRRHSTSTGWARGFAADASPSALADGASAAAAAADDVDIDADADVEAYDITVITGRRRGAGTSDPVAVQLFGTHAASGLFLLDTHEGGFERGSHKTFQVPVPRDIGPLRRVLVSKSAAMDGYGPSTGSWYLKQLEVATPSGEHIIFPCNSWIGEGDTSSAAYKLSCERNLLPAASEMVEGHHEAVRIVASAMAIPHPDKVIRDGVKGVNRQGFGHGGEDAYFYCEGKHHLFGLGVADGVYMWKTKGIDSGLMSQMLMRKCMELMQTGLGDVYKVLDASSHSTLHDAGLKGSCTACLLTINQASGQLHAANLGDSGFMVLGQPHASRGQMTHPDLEVRFRTGQLEHEFGRPYQIGHHEHASKPSDADLVSFYVMRGDIIVAGSDGLLDNVDEKTIAARLTQLLAEGAGASKMVQELVRLAYEASIDKRADTPYAREASEAFNMVYNGGKKDDITVVVALCK